jgi:Uma2 family endonuclease
MRLGRRFPKMTVRLPEMALSGRDCHHLCMDTFVIDLPKNSFVSSFELMNGKYIPFEDYLGMEIEGAFLEWIDGKVIGFMPSNIFHQRIGSFLEFLMSFHAEKHDLGEVIRGDFAMKLDALKRGREPDILFVRKERTALIRSNYLDGPADIAIEIISPESVDRDRKTKFTEYETAGVPEYWLIDPETKKAEFFHIDSSGCYVPVNVPDGVFYSEELAKFFLRIDWLWEDRPPKVEALKELDLFQ